MTAGGGPGLGLGLGVLPVVNAPGCCPGPPLFQASSLDSGFRLIKTESSTQPGKDAKLVGRAKNIFKTSKKELEKCLLWVNKLGCRMEPNSKV